MYLELFWMRGEKLRMWLNNLKIAIVEKNTDAIDKLMDDIPKLENTDDIEEAIYLLKAATELVSGLKDETDASMKQIKTNIKFLRSTEAHSTNKLDIKS